MWLTCIGYKMNSFTFHMKPTAFAWSIRSLMYKRNQGILYFSRQLLSCRVIFFEFQCQTVVSCSQIGRHSLSDSCYNSFRGNCLIENCLSDLQFVSKLLSFVSIWSSDLELDTWASNQWKVGGEFKVVSIWDEWVIGEQMQYCHWAVLYIQVDVFPYLKTRCLCVLLHLKTTTGIIV